MALNNFKVEIKRLDEGQWFTIDSMEFLIRGLNKNLSYKLQKCFEKKKTYDRIGALNEFVFSNLVADWRKVSKDKFQQKVVSDELHKESAWLEVGDINFHLKRLTLKDDQDIMDCTTDDAKQRRRIQLMILDWENLKFSDDDEEATPFSKKTALEIFMNEEYREVYKLLNEFATDTSNFQENVDGKEIKFSKENVEKFFINVDRNDLTNDILKCSGDTKSFQDDLIEKDIDLAKK